MTNPLPIVPVSRPIVGTVALPGSKSITNRALLLAALAEGPSTLSNALFSDDTRYMASALDRLGVSVAEDEDACRYVVSGTGGSIAATGADLFIGNAGTAARFLCAFVAQGKGRYRIDGSDRMRERPIEALLDGLRQMGVDARSEFGTGCPPVMIETQGLRGGTVHVWGDASSQFLSALLMVAPYAANPVTIRVDGSLVSGPYVAMTLRMMADRGVSVDGDGMPLFAVRAPQRYTSCDYSVEPDASGASYFFAAAAVTAGSVTIEGLGANSLQGDLEFVRVLERMGCRVEFRGGEALATTVTGPEQLVGVDADMNDISDTVMTVAAIAPFASSPTTIRNVAHIRRKETDRLSAVSAELLRLGVRVEEREDGLTIYPGARLRAADIRTYDDHRMAMSFAIAGLRSPGIRIAGPGCVSKTFPDFFDRLETLTRLAR